MGSCKKPGLHSGCASNRVYAFQLRPLCIITQSLMHAIASLVDFGTNKNEHLKLTADAFFRRGLDNLCSHVATTLKQQNEQDVFLPRVLFTHNHIKSKWHSPAKCKIKIHSRIQLI